MSVVNYSLISRLEKLQLFPVKHLCNVPQHCSILVMQFKSETEHFKFYYFQNHSTLNCIMLYNYVKISCTDSTLQKKIKIRGWQCNFTFKMFFKFYYVYLQRITIIKFQIHSFFVHYKFIDKRGKYLYT